MKLLKLENQIANISLTKKNQKGPAETQKFKKKHIGLTNPKSPKNQKSPKSARAHGPMGPGPYGPMRPGPYGHKWPTWPQKYPKNPKRPFSGVPPLQNP